MFPFPLRRRKMNRSIANCHSCRVAPNPATSQSATPSKEASLNEVESPLQSEKKKKELREIVDGFRTAIFIGKVLFGPRPGASNFATSDLPIPVTSPYNITTIPEEAKIALFDGFLGLERLWKSMGVDMRIRVPPGVIPANATTTTLASSATAHASQASQEGAAPLWLNSLVYLLVRRVSSSQRQLRFTLDSPTHLLLPPRECRPQALPPKPRLPLPWFNGWLDRSLALSACATASQLGLAPKFGKARPLHPPAIQWPAVLRLSAKPMLSSTLCTPQSPIKLRRLLRLPPFLLQQPQISESVLRRMSKSPLPPRRQRHWDRRAPLTKRRSKPRRLRWRLTKDQWLPSIFLSTRSMSRQSGKGLSIPRLCSPEICPSRNC